MPQTNAAVIPVVIVPDLTSINDPTRNIVFSNISATTTSFYLIAGRYAITYRSTSWGGGSVTLQQLAQDLVTFIPAAVAITADGTGLVEIPTGYYKFAVATATGVYLAMSKVN